jgi:hypothetical protein
LEYLTSEVTCLPVMLFDKVTIILIQHVASGYRLTTKYKLSYNIAYTHGMEREIKGQTEMGNIPGNYGVITCVIIIFTYLCKDLYKLSRIAVYLFNNFNVY